jgi:hypothetical protein
MKKLVATNNKIRISLKSKDAELILNVTDRKFKELAVSATTFEQISPELTTFLIQFLSLREK